MTDIRIQKDAANAADPRRMAASKRRRTGNRGFTLIELLVVTAILGVIVAAILACLAGGIRVWDTARKFNTMETDVMIAFEEIERDLMNAFPFHGINFAGSRANVSFPGVILPGVGARGGQADGETRRIGTVKYFYDESGHALLRKTWTYPASEPPFDSSQNVMSGVSGVKFQYYLRPEGKGEGSWMDSWNDTSNHPGRVRIELSVAGRSGDGDVVARTVCLALDPVGGGAGKTATGTGR